MASAAPAGYLLDTNILVHLIRATGAAVEETSYYPALANLFNAVGRTLKPKVRCNLHPRSQGAGISDGGLYTADQLQR